MLGMTTGDEKGRRMTDLTDPYSIDYFQNEVVATDPDPYFDFMLENSPVWQEPTYGVVIVTGYNEALTVYHHPEIFSSINRVGGPVLDLPVDISGDDITEILEEYRHLFPANDQLVTFDPPKHTDHRALLMGLITPKRLKENEDFLWRLADRQLDEILPQGKCEFVWDYAKKYTVLAVADLLGVPEDDHPMLLEVLAPGPVFGNLEGKIPHGNTLERLYDYFIARIEERRREPREDILTGMAQATFPDGTTPEPIEVARIASNLFAAGQETTVQLLGNVIAKIADDTEMQELLRRERDLIPRFIEETLRIAAPIKGSFRVTRVPTTLGDLDLPAGTTVMLLHGAAGRDARHFENPTEFQVERPNARQHLAFGRGIHTCPGAPLARAETVITIQRLLDRTESLTLSEDVHGPADARRFDLIPTYRLRAHAQLSLEYTPRMEGLDVS